MIAAISVAKPEIAPYPFTTLEPVLGIVELPGFRRFLMADIPGLIEGAGQGAGLGHDFLRHIASPRSRGRRQGGGPGAHRPGRARVPSRGAPDVLASLVKIGTSSITSAAGSPTT